jgi:hypothetical protein
MIALAQVCTQGVVGPSPLVSTRLTRTIDLVIRDSWCLNNGNRRDQVAPAAADRHACD